MGVAAELCKGVSFMLSVADCKTWFQSFTVLVSMPPFNVTLQLLLLKGGICFPLFACGLTCYGL